MVVTALGTAGCAAPEWVHGAMFLSSPSGESVLVHASGGNVSYLRRHSLENGALLASARFSHPFSRARQTQWQCEPALPGRLWCLENGTDPLHDINGLRVRDAESLQIIAVEDQMVGGTPRLAGMLSSGRVDPKTRGWVFESQDGYEWIIDPTTLTPARFAGTMRSSPRPDHASPGREPEIGDDKYLLEGGTRKTLYRHDEPLHPEQTYLRAEFVRSQDGPMGPKPAGTGRSFGSVIWLPGYSMHGR